MKINAPFTSQQVDNLAKWQVGKMHPFTCPNRNDTLHYQSITEGDYGVLVPTVRGWICPFCDYMQDWAHDFMAG